MEMKRAWIILNNILIFFVLLVYYMNTCLGLTQRPSFHNFEFNPICKYKLLYDQELSRFYMFGTFIYYALSVSKSVILRLIWKRGKRVYLGNAQFKRGFVEGFIDRDTYQDECPSSWWYLTIPKKCFWMVKARSSYTINKNFGLIKLCGLSDHAKFM